MLCKSAHANASSWWKARGSDGRHGRGECCNHSILLILPYLPLGLHSSHYKPERVRIEACIDLCMNY